MPEQIKVKPMSQQVHSVEVLAHLPKEAQIHLLAVNDALEAFMCDTAAFVAGDLDVIDFGNSFQLFIEAIHECREGTLASATGWKWKQK